MNANEIQIKRILNLSAEKKTLSAALGFEPRSFDCRLGLESQCSRKRLFFHRKISNSLNLNFISLTKQFCCSNKKISPGQQKNPKTWLIPQNCFVAQVPFKFWLMVQT